MHILWTNSNVYVDHASTIGGRVFGRYSDTLNQKQVWFYRRDAAWTEIYLNNVPPHAVNNLTSKFVSGDVGRFMIGNKNALFQSAVIDFYGLFFYNRNLSNSKMKQMDLYIKSYFKM